MNIADKYGIRADHFGIHIYEMEEACKWYADVFGFTFLRDMPNRAGHFPKSRMIQLGEFWFEVYEVKNARPFNMDDYENRIGVKHGGIAVVKYDEWLAAAKANPAVKFVSEKENSVMITDPSGVLYQVLRDTKADQDIPRGGPFGARVERVALTVYNIEETGKWYSDIFGFERTPEKDRVCPKTGVKIGESILKDFIIEMYERPDAKPFDLINFEWYVGTKHLDVIMSDRVGWAEYSENCESEMPVIVSCGNRMHPEYPITPHYVIDNSNMLVEMSDDIFLLGLSK